MFHYQGGGSQWKPSKLCEMYGKTSSRLFLKPRLWSSCGVATNTTAKGNIHLGCLSAFPVAAMFHCHREVQRIRLHTSFSLLDDKLFSVTTGATVCQREHRRLLFRRPPWERRRKHEGSLARPLLPALAASLSVLSAGLGPAPEGVPSCPGIWVRLGESSATRARREPSANARVSSNDKIMKCRIPSCYPRPCLRHCLPIASVSTAPARARPNLLTDQH